MGWRIAAGGRIEIIREDGGGHQQRDRLDYEIIVPTDGSGDDPYVVLDIQEVGEVADAIRIPLGAIEELHELASMYQVGSGEPA